MEDVPYAKLKLLSQKGSKLLARRQYRDFPSSSSMFQRYAYPLKFCLPVEDSCNSLVVETGVGTTLLHQNKFLPEQWWRKGANCSICVAGSPTKIPVSRFTPIQGRALLAL